MSVDSDSEDVNNDLNIKELQYQDAKEAYIIITKLSDFTSLTVLWRIMQDLGWKYKTSGISTQYISPSGRNMGNSLELMKILDSLALPPVTFRREHDHLSYAKSAIAKWDEDKVNGKDDDSDTVTSTEGSRLDELRQMREELLGKIYDEWYRTDDEDDDESDNQEDNSESSDNDSLNENANVASKADDSDQKESNSKKAKSKGSSSSYARAAKSSRKHQNIQSVTVNEKGTEQYFARKQQKSKRAAGSKATDNLIWPSPQEAVEKMKEIMENIKLNNEVEDGNKPTDGTSKRKKRQRSDVPSPPPSSPSSEYEKITQKHFDENVDDWTFLLSTNHSLLFFGFGSKLKLLNDFTEQLSNEGDVVTLNGYDPLISIEEILDMIVLSFLDGLEPSRITQPAVIKNVFPDHPIINRAISISRKLACEYPRPIYIVLHNIDGRALRNSVAQSAIAALVVNSQMSIDPNDWDKTRVVRLVASIDHVDAAALLWDLDTSHNFSWIYRNVNTYAPYFEEIQHSIVDERQKMKSSQIVAMEYESMYGVLSSFAPRYKEVVGILAQLQHACEKDAGSSYGFIEMSRWRQECMKNMIVSKETEFRQIVGELQDHGIIVCNRKKEMMVCIPTQESNLEKLGKKEKR